MPIGEDRLSRERNLPVALSMAVTVKVGQMRCTYWSMYEPSVEAKYFCSLTRNSMELTKSAPAAMAAALAPSSRSTLSLTGTSMAFLRIGVAQDTWPAPLVGASCTGLVCEAELALAMVTAWRAALAMPALDRSLVAAKPQVPLAMTRTPAPIDSVLTTFCTRVSRVWIDCAR